ncbi:MAG: hypothetical protein WCT05_08355 [Lentisphaeria bacterium]
MNRFSWFILNILLLAVAASSWVLMRKLSVPELPEITQEEKVSREGKMARSEVVLTDRKRPAQLSLEELWEKSLFCPERTERNDSEGGTEAAAQPAEKSEFELTGIAWMGAPGEVKPVAVIKQQKQPPPRPVSRRGRTITTRGRTATRTDSVNEQEAEKPQKVIFAVGDLINDTGYTLSEINTKENSALLVRGSERIELKIDFGSDASLQRRDVAVDEAANRQKQREAEEKQKAAAQAAKPADAAANAAANAVGQPPSPPNASGTGGTRVTPANRSLPATEIRQRTTPGTDSASGTKAVSSSQQQRLQQLYRENAERRARSSK